jgi:aminocarboxymuconate-semialdehyde decarboxylase
MALKVDVHAHLYAKRYIDELDNLLPHPPRTPEERLNWGILQGKIKKNPAMWTIEPHLETMDRTGCDYQILSLSIPQAYEGDPATRLKLAQWNNDEFAEVVAKHPNRFLAFGSIPLPDVDASLQELERCIDGLGLVGVCLGSNVNGMRLDDPALAPVFDEIHRRGIVIFMHPMTPTCSAGLEDFNLGATLGYIMDTGITIHRMIFSGMLERYPNLKVIVPHLGGMLPYHIERIAGSYKSNPACQNIPRHPTEYLRRLYYDVVNFYVPSLRLAADEFGADHLLLGSDYPFGIGDVEAAIRSVQEASFSQGDQDRIFGGNAERLFPALSR